MIKGFKQIASLTALSRVFGMLRDIALAHFFGAGWLMTAWTIGFKVPNLTRRLFGEGAASASFIPVYSRQLEQSPKEAQRLANTVITAIFVLLAATVLMGEIIIWSYYTFFETRTGPRIGLSLCGIMLPYMILICLVAIIAGILNVHRHFASPAAAPIVLNIFIISSICLTGWVLKIPAQQQVFYVAAAVLIAGLAQIAIQIPPLRAHSVSIKPAWDIHSSAFKKVIILMGPMVLGLTVTQINTLVDDVIALSFMSKDGYPLSYGAPSYLYYAQRLYQFPLGVLGISLATAIFPVMSSDAARNDLQALSRTFSKGIKAALFVAIPATVGILLVAKPLISAVFEHGEFKSKDTPIVAFALCCYAVGLCGYFLQQLTTRAFYSLQDSKTPAKSAVVAAAFNVAFNLLLIWFMGVAGLALATAICSYIQVVILASVLKKRLNKDMLDGVFTTLVKTAAATLIMLITGLFVIFLMKSLPESRWYNIIRLTAVVPSAAAVYLIAAKLMKIEMLSLLSFARKKASRN